MKKKLPYERIQSINVDRLNPFDMVNALIGACAAASARGPIEPEELAEIFKDCAEMSVSEPHIAEYLN